MDDQETYVILHCKEGDGPNTDICGLFATEEQAMTASAKIAVRHLLQTGKQDLVFMAETRNAVEVRNVMAALDAHAMIQQDPVLRMIHQLGI